MISPQVTRAILLSFFVLLLTAAAPAAFCQDPSQPPRIVPAREDDTNFDTQLYLILATNREAEDGKTPVALDAVMKRLRDSLTFKHYSLAGTFVNRVRNNGRLDVSWVGGPFLVPASSVTTNPSFSQLTALVKLSADLDGQAVVRLIDFRFGTRVPIVTAPANTTSVSSNSAGFPAINYEPIGLKTDISMREGLPVIAGTLNMGPSGDAIVVVISVKRSAN